MKRIFCCLAATAIVSFLSVAQAEDRAQTSQLPAALAAMNVGSSTVASTNDAEQIRGQGGGLWVYHAGAVGNTTIVSGVLLQASGNIGGLDTNITAAGNHVKLWAGRNDVIVNADGKFTSTTIDFAGKFKFDFVWPKPKY